jgi:hypothetical protein
MGAGPSTQNPTQSKASSIQPPTVVSTLPESSLKNNLDIAIKLVEKYQDNDIEELLKYIKENKQLIDVTDEKIIAKINKYYKDFEENGLGKPNAERYKGKDNKRLRYSTFYEFLEQIEKKDTDHIKQDILKNNLFSEQTIEGKENREQFNTIVGTINTMKAKEKFFKYEYILTQIWIMNFIKVINDGFVDFTTKMIDHVKENENIRNTKTNEMLQAVLKILSDSDGAEMKDFELFHNKFETFKTDISKASINLEKQIQTTKNNITNTLSKVDVNLKGTATPTSTAPPTGTGQPTGAAPPTGAATPKGGRSKSAAARMKGGFVRDGVRFPQAFYEL